MFSFTITDFVATSVDTAAAAVLAKCPLEKSTGSRTGKYNAENPENNYSTFSISYTIIR